MEQEESTTPYRWDLYLSVVIIARSAEEAGEPKVLLLKDEDQGRWTLPRVEFNARSKTLASAASELSDMIGIDLGRDLKVVGPWRQPNIDLQHLIFRVELSDQLLPKPDHKKAQWVTPDQLARGTGAALLVEYVAAALAGESRFACEPGPPGVLL